MPRTLGRRTLFFAATALVCLLLVPAMPPEFRWVAWFSAGLAAFWAVALALEDLTTPGRPREAVKPPVIPPPLFEPPPPPGGAA
jgi:hypothetical protein